MRILILLAFAISTSAYSVDCKLNEPIETGIADLTQLVAPIILKNPVFDQTPVFTDPSAISTGSFQWVELFTINWNNNNTHLLGGSILATANNSSIPESIGFSQNYMGNFNVNHSVSEENGVKTMTTNLTQGGQDERHQAHTWNYEIVVKTSGTKLLSVHLHFPIFEIHRRTEFGQELAFTGEHQDLCLQSADL